MAILVHQVHFWLWVTFVEYTLYVYFVWRKQVGLCFGLLRPVPCFGVCLWDKIMFQVFFEVLCATFHNYIYYTDLIYHECTSRTALGWVFCLVGWFGVLLLFGWLFFVVVFYCFVCVFFLSWKHLYRYRPWRLSMLQLL